MEDNITRKVARVEDKVARVEDEFNAMPAEMQANQALIVERLQRMAQ